MYCNQCGNILLDKGIFCSFCGARNEEASPQNTSAAAPAPEAPAPASESATFTPASTPVYSAPVAPQGYTVESPAEQPAAAKPLPVKEEKYYTFNHILLCLAAVAVMAVVAGVFAGLYFSVI